MKERPAKQRFFAIHSDAAALVFCAFFIPLLSLYVDAALLHSWMIFYK